jgi:hypothetical protein
MSSQSWMPSTTIRLARATRADWPWTATDPDAVRDDATGDAAIGRRNVTVSPSSRYVALVHGNSLVVPCRSSSVSVALSIATIAPQNPLAASSTTRSISASTMRTSRRFRSGEASTSGP